MATPHSTAAHLAVPFPPADHLNCAVLPYDFKNVKLPPLLTKDDLFISSAALHGVSCFDAIVTAFHGIAVNVLFGVDRTVTRRTACLGTDLHRPKRGGCQPVRC